MGYYILPLSRRDGRQYRINVRYDLLRFLRVLGRLRSNRRRGRHGVQERRVHGVPVLRHGLLHLRLPSRILACGEL